VAGLRLAHGAQSLEDLQVLLEVPVQTEERDVMAAVLQVQPVTGAGRVGE
jgi:hypothetical protein